MDTLWVYAADQTLSQYKAHVYHGCDRHNHDHNYMALLYRDYVYELCNPLYATLLKRQPFEGELGMIPLAYPSLLKNFKW
jgi:hypothetical protein